MTKTSSKSYMITIRDAAGRDVVRFETSDPAWAFDEYTRNRDAEGWGYVSSEVVG